MIISVIANQRLELIFNKKFKVPHMWRELPYWNNQSDCGRGLAKVSHSFRKAKVKDVWTAGIRLFMRLIDYPGSRLKDLKLWSKVINVDIQNPMLLRAALNWMLIARINHKYYITNTGLMYLHRMLGLEHNLTIKRVTTAFNWCTEDLTHFSFNSITNKRPLVALPDTYDDEEKLQNLENNILYQKKLLKSCTDEIQVIYKRLDDSKALTKKLEEEWAHLKNKRQKISESLIKSSDMKDAIEKRLNDKKLKNSIKVVIPDGISKEALKEFFDDILKDY